MPTDRSAADPVVDGFGDEWRRFDQTGRPETELLSTFGEYFRLFPWTSLPSAGRGLDLGCGTGRWATFVVDRGHEVVGVDASVEALEVARGLSAATLVRADAQALPFQADSMDFAYSLGVLHHLVDPLAALREASRTLRPGAPMLIYVYYALDHRPWWYRALWRMSGLGRFAFSRLPHPIRFLVSQVIAVTIYWPAARIARLAESRGRPVDDWPLAAYRDKSFYAMRTDALDRFGTRRELRFTRDQVVDLLREAGFDSPRVSDDPPYWCAVGTALPAR